MDSTSTTSQVQLQIGDVVRILDGTEATTESIDLAANTARLVWFTPEGTGPHEGTFDIADLVFVRRFEGGQADGAGTSEAAVDGVGGAPAAAAADSATLYDRKADVREQVKEFFAVADDEVHAAVREHVLSEIDALGTGTSLSHEGTSVIVSAWRNGARIYGHGVTVAAALADFHTNAGPA